MKRIALFFAFLVFVGLPMLQAQTVQITGKITSSEDGNPIPGVSVIVKGTTIGSTTDLDGKYSLNVPSDAATLVFSFVGLKSQEIAVGGRNSIDIVMESDVVGLDEVVVTAMGITRAKKSLGYAVQDFNKDEITRTGNSSLTGALQGKVAGIEIKPSSGMPGASSQVIVRGARSFTGNNTPLYVVDGMPISSTADYTTGNSVTGSDISNRAIDINPNDIETMSILKGQAAAALYGIRASNGVIVITTKSGKNNKVGKPVVTLNHTSTFDEVSRNPDYQTTYAQGLNGGYIYNSSSSWGPKIVDLPNDATYGGNNQNHPGYYKVPQLATAGLDPWVIPQVYNNWKDYFGTGYSSVYNVGISQANDGGNYAVGLSKTDQSGIAQSSGLDRWNVKGSLERKLNNNFKVNFNANYSSTEIDKLSGANDAALAGVYAAPSSYNLKGIPYCLPTDPYAQLYYRGGAFDNPYWAAEHNVFNEKTERVFGNTKVGYNSKLSETLSFNANYQLGIDEYTTHYQDIFEFGHSGKTGQISNYGVTSSTYNSLLTANLDWNISEDLAFNLMVGNELNHNHTKYYEEDGSDFNFGGWSNIENANTVTATETKEQDRTVGYFGNLTLAYRSMLYLNATGRNDVVSSMPRKNRSFFYPSVSLSFVLSELDAVKNSNWLSYGKVRAAYVEVGQAGNYKKNYYAKPTYGGGWWSNDPITYPIGGINAYIPYSTQYDPNLKPQNTKSYEVGAEFKFFNNRLGFDYTYSRQNVTDQIFPVPLAGSTGVDEMYMNGGEVHTDAHEVVFYATPVKTANFQWDLNVNFSKVKNVVDKLAPGVESIFLGGFTTPQVRAGIGNTYPVIYGSSFARNDKGEILVDDDPRSSTYGMPLIGEPDVIGVVSPDFIIGGTNTFSYKSISLSATFEWKNGGEMYSGTNGLLDFYGMSKRTEDRTSTFIYKGVKSDGTPNDIVRGGPADAKAYQILEQSVLTNIDESFVRKNSFVKLRELSLHYKYPKKIYKSLEVSCSVFARNILIWTELDNFDPESSQGNNNMGGAFERFSVPQTTSYGFGLDFTF